MAPRRGRGRGRHHRRGATGGFLCFLGVETYFSSLEKERDREREEYRQNVIEQMNASLNEGADRMQAIIDNGGDGKSSDKFPGHTPSADPLPGVVDPNLMAGGAGGVGGGSGPGGIGAGGLGGAGGGLDGAGGSDGSGGVLLPGRDWASEGFARPGAVQDPPPYAHLSDVDGVGLVGRPVNQTVTPNGLVGGYAPPSAVHASDPRWDPSYRIPHDAVSVGRAASSGALGAIAGGAGGEGEDKKKRRAFTGVFKDEPDEEAGPVWDPAHGPGSADDDIVFEVDLDEWGLR